MSKIVIALGGNALGNSSKEQLAKAQTAAKSIVDLIEQGHQVVIAHGNGPQVGKIRLAIFFRSLLNFFHVNNYFTKQNKNDCPNCDW